MAVVLTEGFDHYQAAVFTAKGWSSSNLPPMTMVAGRFSGQAASFGNNRLMTKLLPSTYSTLWSGFAYKPAAIPGATVDIYTLRAGATLTYRIQIRNDFKLQIVNSAGTVIAIGATALNLNQWYYIETKAVIAGAAGTCELRLDGAAGEIATTTGNFGSTNLDTIQVGHGNVAMTSVFDDIYVVDGTGAAPRNNFLGDVRVETLYPSADGAHSQWTPSAAGTHFDKVNEKTGTFPDGDATYVADATVGDIDSYAVDDLSVATGTIFAVQTVMYARKDDSLTRQIARVVRQGGVDNVGSTLTLGSTYAFVSELDNQDPSGADWTIATVNADEFGVKVIA